jgi:hypothetical protein
VIATSDPCNPYNLPLDLADRDPLSRPRGAGALLVMRGGRVALAVEGRGKRVVATSELSRGDVREANAALAMYLKNDESRRR